VVGAAALAPSAAEATWRGYGWYGYSHPYYSYPSYSYYAPGYYVYPPHVFAYPRYFHRWKHSGWKKRYYRHHY
jgi:hypothetical protein